MAVCALALPSPRNTETNRPLLGIEFFVFEAQFQDCTLEFKSFSNYSNQPSREPSRCEVFRRVVDAPETLLGAAPVFTWASLLFSTLVCFVNGYLRLSSRRLRSLVSFLSALDWCLSRYLGGLTTYLTLVINFFHRACKFFPMNLRSFDEACGWYFLFTTNSSTLWVIISGNGRVLRDAIILSKQDYWNKFDFCGDRWVIFMMMRPIPWSVIFQS